MHDNLELVFPGTKDHGLDFLAYFSDIFSSSSPLEEDLKKVLHYVPYSVIEAMNLKLLAPFGREEIERTLNQMHPSKEPGPDGFPALFYQKYWKVVGNVTVDNCMDILNRRRSIKAWNSTLLALIPKVKKPRKVTDYRPISLCNVSYKIVSKVLANRLKNVLNLIISECQLAFVLERNISDNVVIGHEYLHYMRKKRTRATGYATLKLDMSKTYDR